MVETQGEAPGASAVIMRLAELMFVYALRHAVEHTPQEQGWLRAARDPRLQRVMLDVHRNPGEDWTVERMARAVAMSRSRFAHRFKALLGQSPYQYVLGVRVAHARLLLRDTDASLEDVAERVGYRSVPAFHAAFKRVTGVSPGTVRSLESGTNA